MPKTIIDEINNTPVITVAYGDGIGSEIMEATLVILREAGVTIAIETIEIGERIYNMGSKTGILPSAWEVLRRNKILLKAPTFTPEDTTEITSTIMEKLALLPTDYAGEGMEAWKVTTGEDFALFEAAHAHDYTPEIAGKNIANPTGMLFSATNMLSYIGQEKTAARIKNAWQKTMDAGLHTADIYQEKTSKEKLGTTEFADAIIARLWR